MEIHRFLPDRAVFDPVLSAYKSDEEDFWWIGGPNPCGFLPVEVSFLVGNHTILFCVFGRKSSPIFFYPKGRNFSYYSLLRHISLRIEFRGDVMFRKRHVRTGPRLNCD